MATTVIYAGTGDGQATSESSTYSTARSGSGATLAVTTVAAGVFCGQINIPPYQCQQYFVSFDPSSVPALRVTAVTLSLNIYTTAAQQFTLNARAFDWTGGGLTTADYIAGASLTNYSLRASLDSSLVTTAQYFDFTSDSSFVNNTANPIALIVASSRQESGNAPVSGTSERLAITNADEAGTTYDPKLTVVTSDDPITVNLPPRIAPERKE